MEPSSIYIRLGYQTDNRVIWVQSMASNGDTGELLTPICTQTTQTKELTNSPGLSTR